MRNGRPYGWQFIDLAELGRNTGRSYVAALWRIVLYSLAVAALLGLMAGIVPAPPTVGAFLGILLQYLPIVVAGCVVLWSAGHIHRRPWWSLIAADRRLDGRRLVIGVGVQLAILGGQLALVHALTGWPWRFSILGAVPLFALGFVLIPLQAASEEILFRGYLTQALGRIVRSRVAIAAIVAIIFGLLHLSTHGPLTVPYFVLMSLIFSLVALRDDRLELAIGGHAATNLFGFIAANTTLFAPGIIGLDAATLPLNWASILVLIINGALFYGITRLLVRLFCRAAP